MTETSITSLTFAERAPGSQVQVRQVCRSLQQALVAKHGHDQIVDRAVVGDADAAFSLSTRDDLDETQRQGWLWVAASLRHPEAMAQMSIFTKIRAIQGDADNRLRQTSEQWSRHALEGATHLSSGIDHEFEAILSDDEEDRELLAIADAAGAPAVVEPLGGLVVLPEIGDPLSRDGVELTKRFSHAIGRPLKWAARMPAPGAVLSAIRDRWPWAESIAAEIEAQFAVLRRAGGDRMKLPPILLVGDMGCGKSSLARWIGETLGLSTTVLPCGSASDAGGLNAVTRGWVTARPSLVALAMLQSRTCNPLIVLDEIDKTSQVGAQNGSVPGALLSMVLAGSYYDTCLQADVVIGGVSFIATANSISGIDPALLQRFVVIRMPSPRPQDFGVLLRNATQDFAVEHALHVCEIPHLGSTESNLLRSYFLRNRSARSFRHAYGRLVSARIADVEQQSPRVVH